MALTDKYDFELLRNEAEKLVLDELEKQLEAHEGPICRCNECVMDMAAMALNGIKPLYRVSLLGTMYASHALYDEAYALNLQNVVSNAIEKIRDNPAHD